MESPQLTPQPAPKTNTMALVGFILSVTACCSPAGLALSIIGLSQIKKSPTTEGGRGLAIAGIVISSIGLLLGVLYFVFAIGWAIFSGDSSSTISG